MEILFREEETLNRVRKGGNKTLKELTKLSILVKMGKMSDVIAGKCASAKKKSYFNVWTQA